MKIPLTFIKNPFTKRAAVRLAIFSPIVLTALLAPEPFSRFALILGMLVNFLSGENLLSKYREIAGLRPRSTPPPDSTPNKDIASN
jgi:hypothetical protein